MKLLLIQQIALISLAMVIGCGTYTTQNGGASETINANVTIVDSTVVVKVRSDKAFHVEVKFINASKIPGLIGAVVDSSVLITNNSETRFTKEDGVYNVFLKDKETSKVLAITDIILAIGKRDTISDTLAVSGSIRGVVSSGAMNSAINGMIVYLPGTPFVTHTDSTGKFQLSCIPEGFYSIKVFMSKDVTSDEWYSQRNIGGDIQVQSGKTENITLYFSN